MRKGCKEEIVKLENILERKLSKHEYDLFEFAYDKGFVNATSESQKLNNNPFMPKAIK